ncbi:MAG: polysaccharide deacetylase family protein [Armatimonadota bacterium]
MIPVGVQKTLSESLLLACEGWARLAARPGIPILCYHRISTDQSIATVTPDAFRRQMELLRRWNCRAVGIEQVVSQLAEGGPIPRRWVSLTFDDAYRSFLAEAAPVLGEFGFTAAVFVPTAYAGARADWDSEGVASGETVLSWDEMRSLQESGFRFYPHGVKHRPLAGLADGELARELRQSRDTAESELGRPAVVCCYPYGSYDARVVAAAQAAGYQGACGLRPELNRLGERRWELSRFMVLRSTTARGFRSRITGAFAYYAAARRLLGRAKPTAGG